MILRSEISPVDIVVAAAAVDVVVASLHDDLLDVACCYYTTLTGVVAVGRTAAVAVVAAAAGGNFVVANDVRRSPSLVACCPSGRPILFLGREIGAPREELSGLRHSSFSFSFSFSFSSSIGLPSSLCPSFSSRFVVA